MERKHNLSDNMLIVEHRFGSHENYGDIDFDATANEDTFVIDIARSTGRDRDNYDSYDTAAAELNEEEARDLYLLLHVWLEQRTVTKEDPQHA